MKLTLDQWHALLFAAVALLLAAVGFFVWWRRRPRDPIEVERRRRAYLNQVGRIVEGHILEIADDASPGSGLGMQMATAAKPHQGNGFHKLVFYSYSISGVTYETAQDITGMEERICLERVVAGQHISVKYDPDNPSNSILMADDWSGLH